MSAKNRRTDPFPVPQIKPEGKFCAADCIWQYDNRCDLFHDRLTIIHIDKSGAEHKETLLGNVKHKLKELGIKFKSKLKRCKHCIKAEEEANK